MKILLRSLKVLALVLVALLALLAIAILGFKAWTDSQAFAGYDPSLPFEAQELESRDLAGGRVELIEIAGREGERFPYQLLLPSGAEPPYPCVVLLYGIGQRMAFFDDLAPYFAERGVALAVPEQFDRGVRRQAARGEGKKDGALAGAMRFHGRSARLVPETRRLVDHLLERGDIDPERLDFMGASYGGIMGCAVLRHEPRFRSGVLALAGGDLGSLARHLAEQGGLGDDARVRALTVAGAWWLSPFEPLRHVGEISPRPLLFLNLEEDEIIPRACTEALYAAARTPKEIEWIDASHIVIDEALVLGLVSSSLDWLGRLPAEEAIASTANAASFSGSR